MLCDTLFLLKFIKAQICQFSGSVLMPVVFTLPYVQVWKIQESNCLALHL